MQKMEHLVKLLVSIHDIIPSNLPTYKYQIGHGLKSYIYIDHSEKKCHSFKIINLCILY